MRLVNKRIHVTFIKMFVVENKTEAYLGLLYDKPNSLKVGVVLDVYTF